MMQLTQKECSLLKDLKDQETLCIEKYTKASQAAVDGQLKGLFNNLASTEQQHLDTLTKIESGTVPPVPSGGEKPMPTFTSVYSVSETPDKKNDCYLCSDLLTAEKHASSLYDTCIFEFKDDNTRNVLNHIQKEEQEHGKMIYNYMSANSMY
ncbi:MAG: spore coat protein [Oscillospiraceae bacterium]|nr:spore coat protein [Oscillospiraceae bacterium]